MFKNKKTVNISILFEIFMGVVLIFLMRRYVNEDWGEFIPAENTYAIPFNIGFRWNTLLGMVGTIILQLAAYTYVGCARRYLLKVISWGVWICNAIIYPIIAANSRIYIDIEVRMRFEQKIGIVLSKIWDNMGYCSYAVLVIYVLVFFIAGFFVLDIQKNKAYLSVTKFIDVFFISMGAIFLIIRSFTNVWYIALCVGTILISYVLLLVFEKIRRTDGSEGEFESI